jgi:hypothetical protein
MNHSTPTKTGRNGLAMKLRAPKHWTVRGLSLAVAGVIGLLAYGYLVAGPWYTRAIDDYRWSVIMRDRLAAGISPMMASMESMMPVAAPAGEHHKPLQMVLDYPGVTQPKFDEASSATLRDDDSVFGIVVNGKPYAFAREAFLDESQHIVNLLIDQKPISVTYCNFRDCVRVLTRDEAVAGAEGAKPIDLHVGGLDVSNQLVYLLGGVRYGQSSTDMPLDDFPVERTTFGEWKLQHPETLVYGG